MTRAILLGILAGLFLATKPAAAYLLRGLDTDPQEEPC